MYRKCSVIANKVSDIIDGEVDITTRLRFFSHLMICPKCIKYYNQFKLIKQAASEPDPDQLPADFDKVMSFVMKEVDAHEKHNNEPLRES